MIDKPLESDYQDEGPPEDGERRDALLDALAASILKKRDEAVEFRAASGVERRWREDEKAFDGMDTGAPASMMDYATGEAYLTGSSEPRRSQVVVNIIRGKCEVAEGRFSDIQLPVDDRNWGLKITPVPEVAKGLKDDRLAAINGQPIQDQQGKPIKISDVARQDRDVAIDKMKGMEQEIDDQLTECSYNSESRKLIRAAVRAGTGVLKGPDVVKRLKKSWAKQMDGDEEVHVLQIEEEMKPSSKWVDHWNVYPDPDVGEDIRRAAYIWERDNILPRELRNLIGVEGYFEDQIFKVLREEPLRLNVTTDKSGTKYKINRSTVSRGSMYEIWYYYGDLSRDDLEVLGVDVEHDDMSESFSACLVFVNDKPIKAVLNTLDTGELPYDFFQWTTVTGSPWGIGIPRMMVWLQRIITAAWRAMMDNAGDSAGANIILGPGVQPGDNRWEITGKKIWRLLDDDADVRKVFNQFQITSNQRDLQAIIDLALRFVDMETSLPMLFQGEKGEAPETLGATNIMVDSNNVALRSRVKLYDDQVTRPHLRRYYDWNMQYNNNSEIKGDYNVDARGTSVLLQKDQQAQTLMQVLAAKADPDINLIVDWEEAARQLFTALKLDILKSDEDLEKAKQDRAQQPQVQDPRIQAAQIKTQGELQKAQLVQQSDAQEIQAKAQMTMQELQARFDDAERNRQHERAIEEMKLNVKMMELSQSQGISLEKIKADLMQSSMKLKTQVALTRKDGSAPQIATPVVEPPERAEAGHAYTQ